MQEKTIYIINRGYIGLSKATLEENIKYKVEKK